MYDFSWYGKHYGIELLGIGEEASLPEAAKQTRRNKMKAIDELTWISKIAEQEINRCRRIPVEDDRKHADLVQEFVNKIHTAYVAMEELIRL